ncbi:lipoprotein, partial [Salmonella enterica]
MQAQKNLARNKPQGRKMNKTIILISLTLCLSGCS